MIQFFLRLCGVLLYKMSMKMNNIIKYCQAKQQTMAQSKSKTKFVTGGNDPTISISGRYTKYVKVTKPRPVIVPSLINLVGKVSQLSVTNVASNLTNNGNTFVIANPDLSKLIIGNTYSISINPTASVIMVITRFDPLTNTVTMDRNLALTVNSNIYTVPGSATPLPLAYIFGLGIRTI